MTFERAAGRPGEVWELSVRERAGGTSRHKEEGARLALLPAAPVPSLWGFLCLDIESNLTQMTVARRTHSEVVVVPPTRVARN